jgi:hypothetical protein
MEVMIRERGVHGLYSKGLWLTSGGSWFTVGKGFHLQKKRLDTGSEGFALQLAGRLSFIEGRASFCGRRIYLSVKRRALIHTQKVLGGRRKSLLLSGKGLYVTTRTFGSGTEGLDSQVEDL